MPSACALIVHGGAGSVKEDGHEPRLAGCRAAALAGWEILSAGGAALDAVQRAVEALEDDPWFNAGTGAVLNAAGRVQLDASLMDGATLSAGAVAGVTRLKHPIALARRILEDGRHVLLMGEGALSFARSAGMAECAEQELIVRRQHRRWQDSQGTVGCVALDRQGRLAAGTSTGGLWGAWPGRVGDSALIGCGTYADPRAGVSCTGIGEAIIRTVLARTTVAWVQDGVAPEQAARRAVALLEEKTRREAGLIMIDRDGRVAFAYNTAHMPVCFIDGSGEAHASI